MAVTVLGKTFESEEERREFFREELRKKLPELKKMEGFPIGEDEDIIELSDPPYYTACPNPWFNDFIQEWEKEKYEIDNRESDFKIEEPFTADVSEGKYDSIYRYHPYPTKVPHKAIMRYLLYYTQPGDIVFDGFGGTGMTGVAASLCNNPKEVESLDLEFDVEIGARKTILNDLSPSGTFISRNFNNRILSHAEFVDKSKKTLEEVEQEIGWMFETEYKGKKGKINYTIWADIFLCSNCNGEINYWNDAVDIQNGKVKETFECPHCNISLNKNNLDRKFETKIDYATGDAKKYAKREAVLINFSIGTSRYEKKPDENDLNKFESIRNYQNNSWFPSDRMIEGREGRRNDVIGMTHVHDYYSIRNLIALSKIREKVEDSIFYILITKVAYRITNLYALTYQSGTWGAGGGPTAGTFYVPSLIKELNILNQVKRAIKQRKKLRNKNISGDSLQSTGSSTEMGIIKDNSIDYIFVDPPFGANINYSELAFLWESWLKVFTNNVEEAIEDKQNGKSLSDYRRLLTNCFSECYRILKEDKWMTVIFSNTKSEVWNSIRTAIQEAGFVVANVSSLDKQKGSFKAITTVTAVRQDLVISCYKPSKNISSKFDKYSEPQQAVWEFIEEHLNHLPIHLQKENSTTAIVERSPKILFDRLVAFYVQKGYSVPLDASKFQKGLRERFIERDGMFFTNEQVQEYDRKKAEVPNFTQLSILVASEQDGVLWLQNFLKDGPKTYQDIQPEWLQALGGERKGDIIPELKTILEENFLKSNNGEWYMPDPDKEEDLEKLRNRRLLKQFEEYKEQAFKPKGKIKECRVEALRAGFKQCYQDKDFETIVRVGDRIPNNLLTEDEVLLQFYDIAAAKV